MGEILNKMVSQTAAAAASVPAQLIGSLPNFVLGQLSSDLQMNRQKDLMNYQIDAAKRFGATNAALAQGLAGSASIPAASAGATVPDAWSNNTSAREAEANIPNVESQTNLNEQLLNWNPKRWFADITSTYAQAKERMSAAGLHGQMAHYYEQLGVDLKVMRPWNILQAYKGLQKLSAEIDDILADSAYKKSQKAFLDGPQTENVRSSTYLNYSEAGLKNEQAENVYQDTLEKIWLNGVRSSGFDPHKNPWDNVGRVLLTDPVHAQKWLGYVTQTMKILDDKAKENLGENYKRNAAIGLGLHYLNSRLGEHATKKAQRFNLFTGSIGNLIPFASPASPRGNLSTQGTYWWEKD